MSILNKLKATIFPDKATQDELIKDVQGKGAQKDINDFNDAYTWLFLKGDETLFQNILAGYLRKLAIARLRSNKEMAETYNNTIGALSPAERRDSGDEANFEEHLTKQLKPGEYAKALAISALAEALDVTLACTPVDINNTNRQIGNIEVYRKASNSNAIYVHLYHSRDQYGRGSHFFVRQDQSTSTIGDGNCLYNGFAQVT